MLSDVNKTVTFLANVVTIITFVLIVLKWLHLDVVPDYRPPNDRVANALVILFAVISSFGIWNTLATRMLQAKPTVFLALIYTVAYCFAVSYLRDMMANGLPRGVGDVSYANSNIVAIVTYLGFMFYLYINRMIYPNGFTLGSWFAAGFKARTWSAIGLLLLFILMVPYLMTLFSKDSCTLFATSSATCPQLKR
jgi:hypothetical protein